MNRKKFLMLGSGVILFILLGGLMLWLRQRPPAETPSILTNGGPQVRPALTKEQQQKVDEELALVKALPRDRDGDGLPDEKERELGTDPLKWDSDGDTLDDGDEVYTYKTNPLKAESLETVQKLVQQKTGRSIVPVSPLELTKPTIHQGSLDTDGDGLTDDQELQLRTALDKADTDGDGLSDGEEANTHRTDPKKVDTDADNLSDRDEITKYGTDPLRADSDGDGYPDGEEVEKGYNPLGSGKCPKSDCLK